MNDFDNLRVAIAYVRARFDLARRDAHADERGLTSVEWVLLTIGVVTIAGLAILAVTRFVRNKGNELNGA